MERATIYRAISAPTALVGGLSALAVSAWLCGQLDQLETEASTIPLTPAQFAAPWLFALLLTLGANTLFIYREARRANRPFLSPALRLALRSLIPTLLVAAAVTFGICRTAEQVAAGLAWCWIAFYGLALLATMNFAPRSLSILGWCFVGAAVGWLVFLTSPGVALRSDEAATILMALTFGLFHLVYAACTWRARSAGSVELASE